MHFDIRQGDETFGVEIAESRLVGRFQGPTAKNPVAPDSLVRSALDSPVNAPSLKQAVVPGDRATIAVDSSLPSLERLLKPVVDELLAGGLTIPDLSLLLTPGATGAQVVTLETAFPGADVAIHYPGDKDGLAYLASTQDGRRIYLNRRCVEADFLMLVGRAAADPLLGRRSPSGVLFPLLADMPAMERARTFATEVRSSAAATVDRQGAMEAAWLAGVLFSVSIACDRNDVPSHAWFGLLKNVDAESERTLASLWTPQATTREPDIVIASLSRRRWSDPWAGVAQAAFQALSHAPGSPALLLLTDVVERPGEAMRWLAASDEWSERQARFRSPEGRQAADVVAAAQLSEALANSNVFLSSKLDAAVVEAMGFTPVDGKRELQTAAQRSKAILLVEDADAVW